MRVKYQNLRVWTFAMELASDVYDAAETFPPREQFGLAGQLRAAAVFVPANIAEGCGRYHTRDFVQFLYVARGSLFELMTLLELALRRGYVSDSMHSAMRDRCEKVLSSLSGLIRSLRSRPHPPSTFNLQPST